MNFLYSSTKRIWNAGLNISSPDTLLLISSLISKGARRKRSQITMDNQQLRISVAFCGCLSSLSANNLLSDTYGVKIAPQILKFCSCVNSCISCRHSFQTSFAKHWKDIFLNEYPNILLRGHWVLVKLAYFLIVLLVCYHRESILFSWNFIDSSQPASVFQIPVKIFSTSIKCNRWIGLCSKPCILSKFEDYSE